MNKDKMGPSVTAGLFKNFVQVHSISILYILILYPFLVLKITKKNKEQAESRLKLICIGRIHSKKNIPNKNIVQVGDVQ